MGSNSKKVLWENVSALMQRKYGKENVNGFATYVGIGVGSVLRIREMETSVGVEIIDKIAKKFGLEPWHMLVPDLVVNNPPMLSTDAAEMKELLGNIKKSVQAMSGAIEREGNTGSEFDDVPHHGARIKLAASNPDEPAGPSSNTDREVTEARNKKGNKNERNKN